MRKLGALVVAVALLVVGTAVGAALDTNASLWASLEQSSMWKTYSKQNPNESSRVKSYWLNGGAKPTVATHFGVFLVEVNEDRVPAPPPPAVCANGQDDDGDGKTDYPADPGCTSATDGDETDAPLPPPAGVLELSGTMSASVFLQLVNSAPAGALVVRPTGTTFTVNGEPELNRASVTIQHANFPDGIIFGASADKATLEDSAALSFYIRTGAADVTLQRSVFDGQCRVAQNWVHGATRLRILNNTFRNYHVCADESTHSEAIFVAAFGDTILIQGNSFTDNGTTGHLFFSWFGGSPGDQARNVCVRGNTFRRVIGYYDIQYRDEIPTSWSLYIEAPPSNSWSAPNPVNVGGSGSSFPTKACPA